MNHPSIVSLADTSPPPGSLLARLCANAVNHLFVRLTELRLGTANPSGLSQDAFATPWSPTRPSSKVSAAAETWRREHPREAETTAADAGSEQ